MNQNTNGESSAETAPTSTPTNDAKPFKSFDSKFSKTFQRQIRIYVDTIYRMYTKKFKKADKLNKLEKDFFWIVITYFVNRKVGVRMSMEDVKRLYTGAIGFRKKSSQQKSRIHDKRRLVKKIMK